MKKISDRIRHALAWEFFTERATPWQQGFWINREPGEWINIGLGRSLLCIARLPEGHTHTWAKRLGGIMRGGIWRGLVCELEMRVPFTPWALTLQPAGDSQRGFWVDRRNDQATLVGLGRTLLYVERKGMDVPLLRLVH